MKTPWLLGLAAWLSCSAVRAEDLHVMAFNVLFKGADDAKSVQAIADEKPDVVCLTELTPAFVKAFEKTLGKDYPYRHFEPKAGTWGVGFASKLPLVDPHSYAVPPQKMPALEAGVRRDGRVVTLVCVHLMPPLVVHDKDDPVGKTLEKNAAVRVKQAATLVARFKAAKSPVVLLGDFNEDPGGKALAKLEAAGWGRGCSLAASSCTGTFPGPVMAWPAVFQIDHVYARGLDFRAAKTIRAGGSDHYPVSAVLAPPE